MTLDCLRSLTPSQLVFLKANKIKILVYGKLHVLLHLVPFPKEKISHLQYF